VFVKQRYKETQWREQEKRERERERERKKKRKKRRCCNTQTYPCRNSWIR